MAFEEDLELDRRAQPLRDMIYRQLFPVDSITRFEHGDKHILDVKYHIDVMVKLSNGISLLGQEKSLRHKFSNFNTFTIEFYQNRFTKEQGEFFNLGAQFYFHSYWNNKETAFIKWYLIKIFDFLASLRDKPIISLEGRTRPSTSRASYFYINYNDIPRELVYSSSQNGKNEQLILDLITPKRSGSYA